MQRNYPEELNLLLAKVEGQERVTLDATDEESVEILGRLRRLWVIYRYLVDRGIANEAPRGVRILYAKISNCLVTIYHLLQRGYPGPAAMLIRSLFETNVHLQIILKEDTAARSKLFEDFIHIELESTYAMSEVDDAVMQKHKGDVAAVRHKYHPERPTSWCWSVVPSNRKGKGGIPREPSFRELCSYVGRENDYKMVYGRLSAAIHTVPSYESWLRRESGGPMELGPQFSSRIKSIADLAIALGTDSFIEVVKFLNPDDQQRLHMYVLIEITKFRPEDSSTSNTLEPTVSHLSWSISLEHPWSLSAS